MYKLGEILPEGVVVAVYDDQKIAVVPINQATGNAEVISGKVKVVLYRPSFLVRWYSRDGSICRHFFVNDPKELDMSDCWLYDITCSMQRV